MKLYRVEWTEPSIDSEMGGYHEWYEMPVYAQFDGEAIRLIRDDREHCRADAASKWVVTQIRGPSILLQLQPAFDSDWDDSLYPYIVRDEDDPELADLPSSEILARLRVMWKERAQLRFHPVLPGLTEAAL